MKNTKARILKIKKLFLEKYKDSKTELKYNNIYELLVAVMLSAQCTDKRVNIVTSVLFNKYKNTFELSNADINELKIIIKTISYFNNKASNLIKMAKTVEDKFNGIIPQNQRDLMSLSGVGQKTANVVLSEFLKQNFIAVDTHVFRVSHRLGLSMAKNPINTEKDLTKLFKTNLNILHQAFVLFGRYECKAIKPNCKNCFISDECVYNQINNIKQ